MPEVSSRQKCSVEQRKILITCPERRSVRVQTEEQCVRVVHVNAQKELPSCTDAFAEFSHQSINSSQARPACWRLQGTAERKLLTRSFALRKNSLSRNQASRRAASVSQSTRSGTHRATWIRAHSSERASHSLPIANRSINQMISFSIHRSMDRSIKTGMRSTFRAMCTCEWSNRENADRDSVSSHSHYFLSPKKNKPQFV